jgi:hypothetical protein
VRGLRRRFVLDPVKDKRGHRVSVESVLDDLGIPREELAAEFWLGLGRRRRGAGDARPPQRLGASPAPRRRVQGLAGRFEELMERVLKRFEDRYANVITRLDDLLKVTQPGRAHASQLRDGFPRTGLRSAISSSVRQLRGRFR